MGKYSTWVTKSGKKIDVKDMSIDHLIKTIDKINRVAVSERWFDSLSKELKRRGMEAAIPKKSCYFDCDATEADIY